MTTCMESFAKWQLFVFLFLVKDIKGCSCLLHFFSFQLEWTEKNSRRYIPEPQELICPVQFGRVQLSRVGALWTRLYTTPNVEIPPEFRVGRDGSGDPPSSGVQRAWKAIVRYGVDRDDHSPLVRPASGPSPTRLWSILVVLYYFSILSLALAHA